MKKSILIIALFINFNCILGQNKPEAIHVEVQGVGNPILLIPGFTVPGDVWNPLVDKLQTNYQCHVVTLAGFAGKAPLEFPWLPKVNVALQNYLLENNLKDVIIIGHSLGGTIASWLASRENLHVKQLILVDALPASGALMIPNYNPDNLFYDSPFNTRQLQMSDQDFEQMATGMSQGMSLNSTAQSKIKDWILQADRKTYVYGYTDYLKLDVREDLKRIKIPVAIIAADKPYGKEMATQTFNNQYANLQNYDLIMAENAAHFIMLDKPEWFMEQITLQLGLKE